MDTIKTTIKYWLSILQESILQIWGWIKGAVVQTCLLFVVYYIAAFYSTKGALDYSVANGYLSDISSQLRLIISFVLPAILYLLISIIYLPAMRDKGLNETIKQLTKKNIDANIEIKLFPRQSEGYASIKIVNNEDEDIINYAVYLLGVWEVDKDGNELPITEKVNPDNALISRGGGNATGGEIRRRSEATFNVALHNDKSFYFLFDNGSRRESEQGLYKLKIGFDGNLGNKFINRISKEGYLEYVREIGDIPDVKYPGDNLKRVVVGTFIDIREDKEPTSIQPSSVEDATGNDFWRYVISHPTSVPKKEEPQEGNDKN